MKLRTNLFLVISLFLIGLTFILASFWEALGLGSEESIFLPIPIILACTMNITGFILGFFERKIDPKKAMFGIIGNSILILGFFLLIIFVLQNTVE